MSSMRVSVERVWLFEDDLEPGSDVCGFAMLGAAAGKTAFERLVIYRFVRGGPRLSRDR